jgi:type I restriction enzyme M protein
MLTGEIRSKIDALWNAFWSGGIANPLEVIEPHIAISVGVVLI